MRLTLFFVLYVWLLLNIRTIKGEERLLSVELLDAEHSIVIASFSHQHALGASERTPKLKLLRICVFRDGHLVSTGEFSAESVAILPGIQQMEWRAAESILFIVDTGNTAPRNCLKVDILQGVCISKFDEKLSDKSRKLKVLYKWPLPYGQSADQSVYSTERFRIRVHEYDDSSLTENSGAAVTVALRSIDSDHDFSLDVLRNGMIQVSNQRE